MINLTEDIHKGACFRALVTAQKQRHETLVRANKGFGSCSIWLMTVDSAPVRIRVFSRFEEFSWPLSENSK